MVKEGFSVIARDKLDKESPAPLYYQIESLLEAHMRSRDWVPGDRLPTEDVLCEHFDVSRTVVRRALLNLENNGRIWRSPGKGTFVAQPKIKESLIQTLRGFYEDTLAQGHTPRTRILEQGPRPAPEEVARFLGIEPGSPLFYLKRLRFVDNQPHLISETYLRIDLCPCITERDFEAKSLYAVLESECGIEMKRGRRVVEAVAAQKETARLLQIEAGAPLLLLRSLMYINDDVPFEYSIGMHRADRSRFEIDIIRQ